MSGHILCIGGAALDRKFCLGAPLVPGSSNPATLKVTHGGVARNVAETLARLGLDVFFFSRIGADRQGAEMIAALAQAGVDVCGVGHDAALATAEYVAVLDADGDLLHGLAAMQVLERIAVPSADMLRAAAFVLADCNLSGEVLAGLGDACKAADVPLLVDAVSTSKVMRLPQQLDHIYALLLNLDEAAAITGQALSSRNDAESAHLALAARGCGRSLISAGDAGISTFADGKAHVIDAPQVQIVDVTGAGDALVAGTLLGLCAGLEFDNAAHLGVALAARTVASVESVAPDLSPQLADELLSAARLRA